jgi:hypothetical protein
VPNLLVTATTRYDPKGLNQAKKHIGGFDKTIKSLGKSFAGLFAAQKLMQFGKASVQAFIADEKAAKMLGNTLKNVGQAYAATNVEDYISKLQSATGVLDDELRPALQILLTATSDVAKSQDALALALDISASTGKDLGSVSKALAKGFQGNTTALAKMDGAVSKATIATGDMNKITAELTSKYKGSALTAMTGYAGQMAKLGVAAANSKEIIGKGLLDAISRLNQSKGVDNLATSMEDTATYLADVIRGMGILLGQLNRLPGGFKLDVQMIPILGAYLAFFQQKGASTVKTGYGQQSPGDRKIVDANNKKLALAKKEELALLTANNKAKREEAQMKKDQAALDALKAKFDLERIGLNAALNKATDEETKARIRAQIAILDETGKTAQAANDALVKAQADKVAAELKAAASLDKLANSSDAASVALVKLAGGGPAALLGKGGDQGAGKGASNGGTGGSAGGTGGATGPGVGGPGAALGVGGDQGAGKGASNGGTSGTTGVAASGIPLNDYIAPITEEVKAAVISTQSGIDAILEYAAAATERANAFALLLEQQTAADIANFNAGYLSQYTGTKMGMENGVVITINDNTSGLIEIVQDAVVSNNRYGNTLVPHGAIANP